MRFAVNAAEAAVNAAEARTAVGNGSSPCEELHTVIWKFARRLKAANLHMMKQGLNLPGPDILVPVAQRFWEMIRMLGDAEPLLNPGETGSIIQALQSLLGPWFWRCECWSKSRFKSYGYPGDFRILEILDGLEASAGRDPTRSGMENLLEALYAGMPGTRGLWERRKWMKATLWEEFRRKKGRLRILDIAGGGARYIRDFLAETPMPERLEIWIYDFDPAASAYCGAIMPSLCNTSIRTVTKSLRKLDAEEFPGRFDVVISAGLFDYLESGSAAKLLAKLHAAKAPDGVLAIANHHTQDPTRLVRSWLLEWPMQYRTAAQVAELFPREAEAATALSPEGSLILACSRSRPSQGAPAPNAGCGLGTLSGPD